MLKFLELLNYALAKILNRMATQPKAIAAAPEPHTIDLQPDEVEQLTTAEAFSRYDFKAQPIILPATPQAKIVSWVELPQPVAQNPQITALKEELRAPEVSENRVEVLEIPEVSGDLAEDLSDILAIESPAQVMAVATEVPEITEITELPEIPEIPEIPAAQRLEAPTPEQPAQLTRKQLVESLLDEAWAQGLRTYAQLMKYIELQTSTSCSKKVISAWKKSRKLTEATA